MKLGKWTLWWFFVAIYQVHSQKYVERERTTDFPPMVRFFKQLLTALTGKNTNPRGISDARKTGRLQDVIPDETPFPCDVSFGRSPTRPTSVHQLRPGDIDVIGSVGDSLSAGNGLVASTLLDIAIDNRGLSWVIGGIGTWRQYLTLPNILKEFNTNLIGYAQQDAHSFQPGAKFSVSEPGAMSRDMPYAAKELIKRMKLDKRIDFENDWKLVNFFIGGNDFCTDVCYLTEKDMAYSQEIHRIDLMRVFDFLRDHAPRTIVNFILAPKTDIGTDLVGPPLTCIISNRFECPCMYGEAHRHRLKQMQELQDRWIQVEREVGEDPRYRQKEDFAIVVQTFVPKSRIPKLPSGKSDFTFISTDCFHFSQKGGARAANALWNNMMEPVGNKSDVWEPLWSRFLCPSKKNPYIFTWANSR